MTRARGNIGPFVEALERRVLLSVTAGAGGTLDIVGNGNMDAYVIDVSGDQVTVAGDPDGQDGTFDDVKRVTLDAGGGDDAVVINTSDTKDKIGIKKTKDGSLRVVVKSGGEKIVFDLDAVELLSINSAGGDDRIKAGKRLGLALLQLDGGAGRDRIKTKSSTTIFGGDGDDRIKASADDDVIDAGDGDDRVKAGKGDDVVAGGGGNDDLNGQGGMDTVTYANAPTFVIVSLIHQEAQLDGYGSSDRRLRGFENLTGSNHDDQLEGQQGKHTLTGLDGADVLTAFKAGGGPPTVIGKISDRHGIAAFSGGFDGTAPDQFVDLIDQLQSDGSFELPPQLLERILGRSFGRASLTLHLIAMDSAGNEEQIDLPLRAGTVVALDSGASTSADAPEFTPGQPLLDGNYEITATATDPAGNLSDPSDTLVVGIDTVGPAIIAAAIDGPITTSPPEDPGDDGIGGSGSGNFAQTFPFGDFEFITGQIYLNLSDASDTGLDDSDEVTSDSTPQIEIISRLSGLAVVFVDGTEVHQARIGVLNSNAITLDLLPDGDHEITATLSDPNTDELIAESEPLLITIDTAPPPAPVFDLDEVSDTGFHDDDDLTNDNAPDIDVSGVEESTYLNELFIDDQPVGFLNGSKLLRRFGLFGRSYSSDGPVTDRPLPTTIGLFLQPDGTLRITGTAIDLAGNISERSEPLIITIDTQPPAPPMVDLLTTSDSGVSDSDNITNDNTPSFDVSGEDGSLIELFVNGTAAGEAIADGPVTFTPGEDPA